MVLRAGTVAAPGNPFSRQDSRLAGTKDGVPCGLGSFRVLRSTTSCHSTQGVQVLGADYPFLDVLWTMLIFFAWVIWFWLLITVFADLFRRHDTSGFKKVLWVIFVIVLPFLGVFIYLLVNNQGMADRNVKQVKAEQDRMDDYVRSVAGSGATGEIERAKGLLDSGAITQAEFDAIKQKALAG
jgi:hypothetical protein